MFVFRSVAIMCALLLLLALPTLAATTGGCVDDVTGSFFPNRVPTNCTANDVTFVLVGLGVQTDGCVSGAAGETVSIFMRAVLQNTTAQARYDVGMYLATDGDPNSDGAATGTCVREDIQSVLQQANGTPVTFCGAGGLDLDGPFSGLDQNAVGVGDGPYLSAEVGSNNSTPDACGDLYAQGQSGCDEDGDGLWDDTVVDFTDAVAFPCRDVDSDGFVNIPTCATWGNQANEVHDNTGGDTCESELELVPGTKAKCRCEDLNTSIPNPVLSCAMTCSPTIIQPGQTTSCSVTVSNSASCVPDGGTTERFRCGTAGFVRFKTDLTDEVLDGMNYGAFGGEGGSGASPAALCNGAACVNAAGPSFSDTDSSNGADRILWNVESSAGSTPGLMGPNGDSGTLSFTYTLDPSFDTSSGPPSLSFSTTGYWSDGSGFSPEVEQTTLTCGAVVTTPVTLAAFEAKREGRSVRVEWSTDTEVRTAGFYLYEELEDGWRRVAPDLIPARAVDSTAPQHYQLSFESLAGQEGSTGRLYLESVDVDGGKRLFGPFTVGQKRGLRPRPLAQDWTAIREENAKREGERLALRARSGAEVDLLVRESGIHRVTFEQLSAAGFDFSGVQASQLAVTHRGEAVPVRVEAGEGKGKRFGPGGFVELYAEALDTLYTDTNVYQLTADPSAARRVAIDRRAARGSSPAFYVETLRVERERLYSFGSPITDPWYDTSMLSFGSPGSWSFPFSVDDLAAGMAPAVLEVDLWGSTVWPADPDHHVVVSLNGTRLADELFNGRVGHTIRVEIPDGLLREGSNTLGLELPGDLPVDFDLVNLDAFSVTYPRLPQARDGKLHLTAAGGRVEVGGLTEPEVVAYRLEKDGSPVWLAGVEVFAAGDGYTAALRGVEDASYAVTDSGSLLAPGLRRITPPASIHAGTAPYLVISHPSFVDALAPLAAARDAEGLAMRVVSVEDIFRVHSYGIFDPEAIRAYIAHAASEMGTQRVLLVGGDTFDYRDYLGIGSVSYIPSLYTDTGGGITFAPSDPLYADVDGDRIPDLPIGRLPARRVEELESLVDRTLEYQTKSYGRTSVLVADEYDRPTRFSFSQHSDTFLEGLGEGWEAERLYLDDLEVGAARDELLEAIEAGVALTCFTGHSGPTTWTFDGLFTATHARALENSGRPTVVVQWGCWNSYYVEPRFETLSQSLLLSGDRGAAALLGVSGLVETPVSEKLSRLFAARMAVPGTRLGDAMTEARRELALQYPEYRGALLGWTLLGDPALVIEP